MDFEQKKLQELHADINKWKELVELVRDETRIFEHQLEQILQAGPSREVMPYIQKFESMFIRQNEVSDELFHDLKAADHELKQMIDEDPAVLNVPLPDHDHLRDKVNTYENLFLELRNEFRHFHLMASHPEAH
ncbi:MAG: hypothetical protein H6548_03670 [Chitinophagales bacterium]|nr:hypothetical protein [Chitinophagales bacterium]MCB9021194.1 hypothetical protein [Chitinophagales bacterium]HAE12701.1 hypothetical protein [Bacteroidota bacterium]HQU40819.1 hypothetical protein [Chitinophagales bacterium]HQU76449.1 hypothetical protein [Chitinophagales bacterium]